MTTAAREISISTSFHTQIQHDCFNLCEINGAKFALFSKEIKSLQNVSIDLSEYNVVFLAPIEAEGNISVRAISVIALPVFNSEGEKTQNFNAKGHLEICASGKLISLGSRFDARLGGNTLATKDVHAVSIIKNRGKAILNTFMLGISSGSGPTIVDALVETFDAVIDPSAENAREIDIADAFQFFNIPIDGLSLRGAQPLNTEN